MGLVGNAPPQTPLAPHPLRGCDLEGGQPGTQPVLAAGSRRVRRKHFDFSERAHSHLGTLQVEPLRSRFRVLREWKAVWGFSQNFQDDVT